MARKCGGERDLVPKSDDLVHSGSFLGGPRRESGQILAHSGLLAPKNEPEWGSGRTFLVRPAERMEATEWRIVGGFQARTQNARCMRILGPLMQDQIRHSRFLFRPQVN